MKALKISLFVCIMILGLNANAQQLFNVQSGTKSLFFESFDEAIGQAVSGDTIYLPGMTVQVAEKVIIDKKLAIIGAGYDADSIGGLLPTRIMAGTSLAKINFRNGSDGSMLTGCAVGVIEFGHSEEGTNYHNIKDILIWRNSVYSINLGLTTSTSVSHVNIKENILTNGITGQNAKHCIISNNIINDSSSCIYQLANSQIENNFFKAGLRYLADCTVDNNFFKSSSSNNYNTNSIFRNNASTNSGSYALPTDGGNTGNLNGVSMDETLEGGTNANTPAGYRIIPGSVCEKAGLDGTDIGIFGGSSPFKMGGKPSNPHIDRSVVSVQTDGEGKLKIDIQVSAQER